jgi:HlyD family secretion protein
LPAVSPPRIASVPGRSKTQILLIVLAIAAVLLVAVFLLTRPKPIKVLVAPVERGRVQATVSNTRAGTVQACQRAKLAPALGGQIESMPVHKGDRVKKGDLLLELWNADLRAQQLLAQRDRIASLARADEACITAGVASREARRLTQLREQKLVSEEQTEKGIGEADSQAASCKAAKENARVAQARLDVAAANLERTQLRAPFDGVVAEINGKLGEFVTPSPVGIPTLPVVDLTDNSCLYISAPIDEVDAPRVRAGQHAMISLDAFVGHKFPGFVRRVAPYVLDTEKQARTVEIEAEIENPAANNLLPGYSADVEVLLDAHENVLRVPTQSVMEGKRVLVLDAATGRLRSRDVTRGISNWEFSEIAAGLKQGDLVVISVDREGVKDGAAAERE